MTTQHSDDRRSYPRVSLRLRVTYQRINAFIQDYTSNISQGGMFLATTAPLEMGSVVELDLEVPSLREPVTIRSRVQWIVEGADAAWDPEQIRPGMGVQFEYESEADRRRVESTVEGLIRRQLGPRAYEQLMGKG